jgi:hypothetical protein
MKLSQLRKYRVVGYLEICVYGILGLGLILILSAIMFYRGCVILGAFAVHEFFKKEKPRATDNEILPSAARELR